MARWSFNVATWTPSAVADATLFTDSSYMAIQGQTASSWANLLEVYCGGQATSSAPLYMVVAYDSQAGATLTALSTGQKNAPLNPLSPSQASTTVFVASTTKPKRSSTLGILNLSYNAFGGIVKWTWAPGQEISVYGNAASIGELSLSAYTGGGNALMGSHMIYDTF